MFRKTSRNQERVLQMSEKKISSATLYDFQSHKETKIDLSPGVNVIVGNSDAGKSAITRAIRAVMLNECNNRFVRHGKDVFEVLIEFDNGWTIGRIKGDGENIYILKGKEDKKGVEFTKFKEVPREIQEAIGEQVVRVDDSDKNGFPVAIGGQHDPYFLISSYFSSPSRAKLLGQISGVDLVDRMLKFIQEDTRKVGDQFRDNNLRIQDKKNELKEVTIKLDSLEKMYKPTKKALDDLNESESKLEELKRTFSSVESIDRQLDECEKSSGKDWKTLEKLERYDLESLKKSKELLEELEECLTDIQDYDIDMGLAKKGQKGLDTEVEMLTDQVKKLGKCPYCLQPVSTDHLKKILESI
jgi:DNA repair ATPase RecN